MEASSRAEDLLGRESEMPVIDSPVAMSLSAIERDKTTAKKTRVILMQLANWQISFKGTDQWLVLLPRTTVRRLLLNVQMSIQPV